MLQGLAFSDWQETQSSSENLTRLMFVTPVTQSSDTRDTRL